MNQKCPGVVSSQHQKPIIHAVGPGWLIVVKPSGLSIHNDPGEDLVSKISDRVATDRRIRDQVDPSRRLARLHAVNRLDRETSGMLVLAAGEALEFFGRQFADRTAAKAYLALTVRQKKRNSRGQWRWPLSKTAAGRKNPAGRPPRKPCATDYRVLSSGSRFCLLHCRAHTGRKHQIRRHAALAGFPLVGDRRYGLRAMKFTDPPTSAARLALHAYCLRLMLPGANKPQLFFSMDFCEDIMQWYHCDHPEPPLSPQDIISRAGQW